MQRKTRRCVVLTPGSTRRKSRSERSSRVVCKLHLARGNVLFGAPLLRPSGTRLIVSQRRKKKRISTAPMCESPSDVCARDARAEETCARERRGRIKADMSGRDSLSIFTCRVSTRRDSAYAFRADRRPSRPAQEETPQRSSTFDFRPGLDQAARLTLHSAREYNGSARVVVTEPRH